MFRRQLLLKTLKNYSIMTSVTSKAAQRSYGSVAPQQGPLVVSSEDNYTKIMEETDTFLFDCDGVIWHGDDAIPGAAKMISRLREIGKKVFFVSNNSTKTRDEYLSKFERLGFNAEKSEVFGTAYASAQYLKRTISETGKVYLIGNAAMEKELQTVGIECFGRGPDSAVTIQSMPQIRQLPLDPKVEAVLVGMDGHISYTKLVKAASYLTRPGCKFVATNEDRRMACPGSDHIIIGTGVVVKSVAFAAAREPDVICGKPHSWMLECIKEEADIDFSRAVMVGDRMNTDIAFGNRNGMKTLLVMSGVTTDTTLKEACEDPERQEHVPHYCLRSLNDWAQY